ncbi:helix-turn-helix transcriptional regulator [Nitratireductor mangrovi]|uniref:Helix-turn-helix transcriptional regulator n=1 Tax=Nitratireductor mangrovi TaxID=2599600 RepID=A0A5B8L5F2_9HYPH|nr:helix-turn-helix transcriptional regulator [Nitratireductor mangrovi]QDZ03039.1 helix-turn-helix transcriptional regulator [Nitratireductor mangrovi]
MTFGARFGLLVRRYRENDGISASDLALKALGDIAKRSRVSEIENGKVAQPQAKTISALCEALGISDEEVEACRHPPVAVHPLPQDTGLPSALLENLAMRFGHDNPDAPAAELESFLKQKAKDFQEMQVRLSALAEAEGRIANLMAAAQAALAGGDFEEADARLADAEEMQQTEYTLKQIRKQVDLRVERGRAALLKGDANLAAEHFQTAAGFFAPFSEDDQAGLIAVLATELYDQGKRFGGAGLAEAVEAYRAALRVRTEADHPVQWAMTQENIGLTFVSLAIFEPDRARTHVETALLHLDNALTKFDPVHMPFNHNKAAQARERVSEALAELGGK